ncbi:multidrug ABC transporter substrate-binding protein [Arachidicoccus ginsenosidimutans]|uniref:ABC transporter permease n=1 Tax=Arachidicoccus sp. BS20 TaxID=1850526 RepID=UPI0007F07399|nr:ABC transporter permease [Arachidicoccus sp. BS20]ANI90458.1 multidrug ABC transporter substrate-binding protein [Arachidicoccus sp. BS20]
MGISNLIKLALRALQRNKLRAFLTMLGIIIGVAAVIAMMAIGNGSKESIRTSLSGMGSNMINIMPQSNISGGVRIGGSSFQSLTMSDVRALQKNVTLISDISPVVQSSGQVINGANNWNTQIIGVAPSYLNIRQFTIKDGVNFDDKDVETSAKVCLLGQTVVTNLFPNGENPIGQFIRFKSTPFQVIGTLNSKGQSSFGQDQDDIILAPYTTVQNRITAQTIYLNSIYASAVSEDESDSATTQIENTLRQNHRLKETDEDDFSVRTQAELISTISSTSSMLTVLLTSVAAISLLIGGIGIMNIMYVSVTERTREIGLRMAIGARGIDILMQFLIEAIIISITGGLIGVLLGLAASFGISYFAHWPILISETSIVVSFLVCGITGIFFGYYPAQKAARLDPIEALRYE